MSYYLPQSLVTSPPARSRPRPDTPPALPVTPCQRLFLDVLLLSFLIAAGLAFGWSARPPAHPPLAVALGVSSLLCREFQPFGLRLTMPLGDTS